MEKQTLITPIAFVRSDFQEKFGVPRQSGRAPSLTAKLEFLPSFTEEAFRGIQAYSHLWIVFDFSLTREKGWTPTVRPPRLGGNTRVGVFASRSPFRPNHIGLSCVKLLSVEKTETGIVLAVSGADLLDGTPVFDVKPYIPYADCVKTAVGGYADEQKDHKLEVIFPEELLQKLPREKQTGLLECLADDPRPSYQNDPVRIYGMNFAGSEIKFTVEENTLKVVSVE